MTLERYRRSRLVVLTPSDTVHDAARAMEANHVGAVVVQDQGALVGIVTDRDVALRVTAYGLDPYVTELAEIMTLEPVCLSPQSTEGDALALMRERHVRRVPIIEDGQTVGMVTLDDLILALRVVPKILAEVVREQLEEPSARKPRGLTHPTRIRRTQSDEQREQRHRARAERTLREFVRELQRSFELATPEQALSAFEVVATALVRRLEPRAAIDFMAQLPSLLRERLREEPAGPDRSVTVEAVAREMARRLELDQPTATRLVARVGATLARFVASGELAEARAQVPRELRALTQLQA